jgi:hypothetical protein
MWSEYADAREDFCVSGGYIVMLHFLRVGVILDVILIAMILVWYFGRIMFRPSTKTRFHVDRDFTIGTREDVLCIGLTCSSPHSDPAIKVRQSGTGNLGRVAFHDEFSPMCPMNGQPRRAEQLPAAAAAGNARMHDQRPDGCNSA